MRYRNLLCKKDPDTLLFERLCLRQLNEKLASDPPAKHSTTGTAIASPSVAMSQSFGKQANVL